MTAIRRDRNAKLMWLTPEIIKDGNKIKFWRSEEGGFQRDVIPGKVNTLGNFMRSDPVGFVSAVDLAKVKGEEPLYPFGGQHRLLAGLQEDMQVLGVVYEFDNLEDVRAAYIKLDLQTKLNRQHVNATSHNRVANKTRELAKPHGALFEHIRRLGTGLRFGKATKYFSVYDHNAVIPSEISSLIKIVMEEWTKDKRWKPEHFPSEPKGKGRNGVSRIIVNATNDSYCVPGVLQSVGAAINKLEFDSKSPDEVRKVVQTAQRLISFDDERNKKEASSNSIKHWSQLADTIVTLFCGVAGIKKVA